jgi:hypothetical protein
MINDKSSIQYVAHAEGVQIIGNLPPQFSHIKMKHDQVLKFKPFFVLLISTFMASLFSINMKLLTDNS